MKPSSYYFYVRAKILVDFHICISVPSIDVSQEDMTSSQPAFTVSKLTIETLELGVKYVQRKQRHQNDAIIFIVNFEHISHLVLVFLL